MAAQDSTLQPGSVLQKRYRITGVIGVGDMGMVYQARDLRFPNINRFVAVKEMLNLSTDLSIRDMTLKTFEREADMMASLNHPFIPTVFDYFPSKTRAYLVMEYINGRDLEAILNTAQDFLPVETVLQWALDLCDVLGYLHQHDPPCIHRNIQPTSVMIDEHNRVHLVGFALAKVYVAGQKGSIVGPPEGFMAPEQYRGQASPASDVYNTGALLHHLLTRSDPRQEPPFTFADRPIKHFNPHVPDTFSAIVDKALEFSADDRYPDCAAMSAALRALES